MDQNTGAVTPLAFEEEVARSAPLINPPFGTAPGRRDPGIAAGAIVQAGTLDPFHVPSDSRNLCSDPAPSSVGAGSTEKVGAAAVLGKCMSLKALPNSAKDAGAVCALGGKVGPGGAGSGGGGACVRGGR